MLAFVMWVSSIDHYYKVLFFVSIIKTYGNVLEKNYLNDNDNDNKLNIRKYDIDLPQPIVLLTPCKR